MIPRIAIPRTALVVAAALLSSACTFGAEAVVVSKESEFDGQGWDTLSMDGRRLQNDLVITAHPRPTMEVSTEVTAVITAGEELQLARELVVTFDQADSTVFLNSQYVGPHLETFGLLSQSIRVPIATTIDVEVLDADVDISGVSGSVLLDSGAGDVSVRTTGGVSISSASGDVILVAGAVDLRTDAADAQVESPGFVNVESATGDLNVTVGGGGAVFTRDGRIDATVTGDTFADLTVATENGEINLFLPAGLGFELNLSGTVGDVDVDAGGVTSTSRDPQMLTIGAGGPTITVDTRTGNVFVREN